MPLSRFNRTSILDSGAQYGTNHAAEAIRSAIKAGQIRTKTQIMREAQRLDTIAGVEYGDASLWWVICAASNAGWSLQIPPGTILTIPNLADVQAIVG